jgi:hypothetical protein
MVIIAVEEEPKSILFENGGHECEFLRKRFAVKNP